MRNLRLNLNARLVSGKSWLTFGLQDKKVGPSSTRREPTCFSSTSEDPGSKITKGSPGATAVEMLAASEGFRIAPSEPERNGLAGVGSGYTRTLLRRVVVVAISTVSNF